MIRLADVKLRLGLHEPILIKNKSREYKPNKESGEYIKAKEFAVSYGRNFCEYVFSDIDTKKRTNLAIMLNGAEHLGSLLEAYILQNNIPHTRLKYLWFTSDVIGLSHQVDEDTGNSYISWSDDFGNSDEELTDYLYSKRVFECDTLVGIETGLYGHTIYKIASLAKKISDCPDLKGRVFEWNDYETPLKVDNLDITGFNKSKNAPNNENGYMNIIWEIEGNLPASYEPKQVFSWNEDYKTRKGLFQKSRKSPHILHKVKPILPFSRRGIWIPDTKLYESPEDLQAYANVVAGLKDGLE